MDTGALTSASAASSAVTQIAQNPVKNNVSGVPQRHWIITVQVEGFGDSGDDDTLKKRRPGQFSYNPSSEVLVLGFGKTGDNQRAHLTQDEQKKLGDITGRWFDMNGRRCSRRLPCWIGPIVRTGRMDGQGARGTHRFYSFRSTL